MFKDINTWHGLPYHPISRHYKNIFGEKVTKIPVTVAETCPNREGLRGMKTCNFCDAWGSAAYHDLQGAKVEDQITEARRRILKRMNCAKFIIYFQAYTTTFASVKSLRKHFELASQTEDVVGIVVGTRPDCISDALFELLNEYAKKFYVGIEYGVQSFDEDQLLWMRRGHTAKKSIEAIYRTKQQTNINVGIHLIFGLPNETSGDVIRAAKLCNDLPIDNVKLHNLHVLENTPLAEEFFAGQFVPLSLEHFTERVALFLQHLHPRIAVHRLAATASRQGELVAPEWTKKKMETYQYILDWMNLHNAYQGQLLSPEVSLALP